MTAILRLQQLSFLIILLLLFIESTAALQQQQWAFPNLLNNVFGNNNLSPSPQKQKQRTGRRDRIMAAEKIETELLDLIQIPIATQQPDENNDIRIVELIRTLETQYKDVSIPEPAIAEEIYGRWQLVYSTVPETASPIQRTAFNKRNQFPIYQDIIVVDDDKSLQVNQIIQFSDTIYLSIDAIASTAAYPVAELTERQTSGKIFGLNVLGVSYVGEEAKEVLGDTANDVNSRIDFVFDAGNLYIDNNKNDKPPITIPYPVPFRLPILRDWVKGWIAITYMSPTIRISRGNKGTTFVLLKK